MSKGLKIASLVLAGAMLTGAGVAAGTFLTHNDADARIEQAEKEFENKYNVQVGYTEEEMQNALNQEREKAEAEKQQAVEDALKNASAQGLNGDIDEFLNLYKNTKVEGFELDDKIFIVGEEACPGFFVINKTNKNIKRIDSQLYSKKVSSAISSSEYLIFGDYLYINLCSTANAEENSYKINTNNLTIENTGLKFVLDKTMSQHGEFYYISNYQNNSTDLCKISINGEYSHLNYYDENNEEMKAKSSFMPFINFQIYGDIFHVSVQFEDPLKQYDFFEFLENGDIKVLELEKFDIQNSSIKGTIQDVTMFQTSDKQDVAVYNTSTKMWAIQLQKGAYTESLFRQTSNKFFVFYSDYGFYKWDLTNNTFTQIEEFKDYTSMKMFGAYSSLKVYIVKKEDSLKFDMIIIDEEIKTVETPILTQDVSIGLCNIKEKEINGVNKLFISITYRLTTDQTSKTIYYDISENQFYDNLD